MKIVYLDKHALNPGDIDFSPLESLGCEIDYYDRTTTTADTIARIGNAEIIITNKTIINREVLDACPSIKYITITATGYNVVDVAECARRGIPVSNVPSYSTFSVAQHIFALLFEHTNKVFAHAEAVKRGMWATCPDYTFSLGALSELCEKTIGFIGMGAIGTRAALIAQALGMKTVCYHSRASLQNCEHLTLDQLLSRSDVVALCCPITADNAKMINAETISKMRDGVILINTSRGGLIDEPALADALNSGKVAFAGLDVLTVEPPTDSPLISAKNCVITPHIAWAPYETRARLLVETVENIKSFLSGDIRNLLSL